MAVQFFTRIVALPPFRAACNALFEVLPFRLALKPQVA